MSTFRTTARVQMRARSGWVWMHARAHTCRHTHIHVNTHVLIRAHVFAVNRWLRTGSPQDATGSSSTTNRDGSVPRRQSGCSVMSANIVININNLCQDVLRRGEETTHVSVK